MLNVNPNNRYDAQVALKHPWITRDKNGIVPLSMYEEMQLNIMSYDKLKLIQRATYAMSIINDRVIKNRKKSENNVCANRKKTLASMISVEKFSDDESKGNDYDIPSPGLADGFNNHLSLVNLQKGTKLRQSVKSDPKHLMKKINLSKSSNPKKREFRIKRQKSLKKRLFSAYPREEESTNVINASKEFKGKINFNMIKAITPLLPPILNSSNYYNTSVQVTVANDESNPNIRANSSLKKVSSIAKQKKKKAKTRRFSEVREDSTPEISNVESGSDSREKVSAPLELQHRIDVLRNGKKPVLQHLINMNIEPSTRILNDFIKSPTTISDNVIIKIVNQSNTLKSNFEVANKNGSHSQKDSPKRNYGSFLAANHN